VIRGNAVCAAAFGVGSGARAALWQTGVKWAEEEQSDLMAFTLDKTSNGNNGNHISHRLSQ